MIPNIKSFDVGVIVGRFQTPRLTEGHYELFKKATEAFEKVIVFIGSSVANSERNPLDFNTREDIIIDSLDRRDINLAKITTIPLQDQKDDNVWSRILDQKIRELVLPREKVVLLGGRDSFFPHYTGRYDYIDIGGDINDNATAIRKNIQLSQYDDVETFAAGVIYHSKQIWNNPMPVVDMGVIQKRANDWYILLGRKQNEEEWRFPGGFVDAGESMEEAAARELLEETQIELTAKDNYTILGTQVIDDWRYRGTGTNIISTFFATVLDPNDLRIPVPDDDLVACEFFSLKQITPAFPIVGSHVDMLNKYLLPYIVSLDVINHE